MIPQVTHNCHRQENVCDLVAKLADHPDVGSFAVLGSWLGDDGESGYLVQVQRFTSDTRAGNFERDYFGETLGEALTKAVGDLPGEDE